MADWLFIGPVPFNKGDEPFKELGGIAQLRLHEGQIVETDGKSYRAETLPTNAVVELKLERVAARYVRIPNQLPDHRCYFFSLVTFGHRLACRPVIPFRATTGEARLWIDGEPVGPDGVIVFEPGLHRVLIETPGARIWPKFEPIDLEYLEGSLRRYPVLKEHWEHLRAQQKMTGLMSTPRYAAEMCRRGMRTWLDYRIDRAGRADVQWPFVHACRVVLGQPLSPDTPFPWADGIRAEDLKELTGLTLCFAMGLAPDHVKDTFAKEFERRYQQEGWEKLGCLELIAALVNYPLTPERDEGWHLIEQARQEKAVE